MYIYCNTLYSIQGRWHAADYRAENLELNEMQREEGIVQLSVSSLGTRRCRVVHQTVEGVENPAYQEEGVENPAYQEEGVENPAYREEGLENPDYQDEGVENPDYQDEGVENPACQEEGVENPTYQEEGVENSAPGVGNRARRRLREQVSKEADFKRE